MCGIAGELIFNERDRVDPAVLRAMCDAIAHRGPDDAGTWISPEGRVGLGSRRLSIVDLSPAGHMPMSNEDGAVWITYNGEVYNHARLRPGLEQRGHRYRSRTDTETIVHLYEELGERCVEKLDGMFAFALWDQRHRRLLLARDPFGKKPLYYWRDSNRLVFASEIKALLRHPSVPRQPDLVGIYHYLSLSVAPAPHTAFAGIQKLGPAHTLCLDASGRETSRRYWCPLAGPRLPSVISEEEAARELLYLLRRSVADRMMSDVPFGVFLSGGIDSSTNVALMSQLMDRPVDTFSVALADNPNSNEFDWARRVAKHFHCNHHEIVVTEPMFLDFVEQMPYYQDEPLADPVCVPLYYVSKLARDHGVIVVQVGEGSDEIFAGYDGYRHVLEREEWAELWRQWVPASLTGLAARLSRGRLADFLRRLRDNEQIFWGGAIAFYETEKRSLLTPAFAERTRELSTWPVIRSLYEAAQAEAGADDFLQLMTYVELKQRLAELLLMRVDKMSMAVSVEARVPYLDRALVEFAMRLPRRWKIQDSTGKHIFRLAVQSLLPPEILHRPKRGFCGSAANMLSARIRDKLVADIRGSAFLRELLAVDRIHALANPAGNDAENFKLWNLWNLALWHKRWFA
jgi:asparagine synthase (glutamine-hydrolysing)